MVTAVYTGQMVNKEFTLDMTKRIFCVLALSASASFLMAQPAPPSPEKMVARRVSHLTTLLSLTTAQQADATTIFTSAQTALATARDNMRTARTALQAAVQKNDITGINAAATSIGTLTIQEVEVQAKADASLYALLTPDQKTKFDALGAHGGGRGGPGGPGGPHGFGGPRQ